MSKPTAKPTSAQATEIGNQVIAIAARRAAIAEAREGCQQAIINMTDCMVQLEEEAKALAAELAQVTGS